MSRKSRSLIETMTDWMPRWPKRQHVQKSNTFEESGMDSEVCFNHIPDKYGIDRQVKSAPPISDRPEAQQVHKPNSKPILCSRNAQGDIDIVQALSDNEEEEFHESLEHNNSHIQHFQNPKYQMMVHSTPKQSQNPVPQEPLHAGQNQKLALTNRQTDLPQTILTHERAALCRNVETNNKPFRPVVSNPEHNVGQYRPQVHVDQTYDKEYPCQVQYQAPMPVSKPSADQDVYQYRVQIPRDPVHTEHPERCYRGPQEPLAYPNLPTEQPVQHISVQNRRQREPDKFNGETIEWLDYYRHFETVAQWNNWGEVEKAMQLAMSLQGEAQRILGDLPSYTLHNYEALVNELTQRFNPFERGTAYRLEFRNRTRKSNESAMQYGYVLKRLAAKAFPQISIGAQEQWIIDQFITGLGNIELSKHVQFSHPKTVHEAIALAVEYESFDPTYRQNRKPPVVPSAPKNQANVMAVTSTDSHTEAPMNQVLQLMCDTLMNTSKELTELRKEFTEIQKTKPSQKKYEKSDKIAFGKNTNEAYQSRQIECFKCHGLGHMRRECPLNQKKIVPLTTQPDDNGSSQTKHLNSQ